MPSTLAAAPWLPERTAVRPGDVKWRFFGRTAVKWGGGDEPRPSKLNEGHHSAGTTHGRSVWQREECRPSGRSTGRSPGWPTGWPGRKHGGPTRRPPGGAHERLTRYGGRPSPPSRAAAQRQLRTTDDGAAATRGPAGPT